MRKFTAFMLCAFLLLGLTGCGKKTYPPPEDRIDPVAEITLYAYDPSPPAFGLVNLGHAFITVKNTGSATIYINGFILPSGSEVSIGTWGQQAHWGIWYNLESHYLQGGNYAGCVSMSHGISSEDIQLLSAFLAVNDKWTPLRNCSRFASDIWNLISGQADALPVGGLVTPAKIYKRISRTQGHLKNRDIATFGQTGYMNAEGLVPYSLYSL